MELRVLGPVEASVGDQPVAIGAGKPRALLAMLALNEGSPISAEALIDGLWGDAPPATAPKMVQIYVSQLRKAFRASGNGNGAEIVTRSHGYELQLGEGEVDVRRFERLVAAGTPRDALALWRGRPLDDVATEPFAGLEIRRLEELRVAALELALEQDLAAGRHAEVLPELERLILEEPLRERLHAMRMLALYRDGRQAAALEAYRRARKLLVESIGVEPGPELRRMHEAVLRQDPALDLAPSPSAELPPELEADAPLVGRDAELAALREHWRRARAGEGAEVLLTGAPGIGKTRLAAELAAEVRRNGAHVLYASGAGSSEAAHRVVDRARRARHPTLLVFDDAGHAPGEVTGALERLSTTERPLLVLVTAEDAPGATMTLGPLTPEDVATIARSYGEEPPVEHFARESQGVPRAIHRLARRWARDEAARRLGASADRAAGERVRMRAAEDDLAAGVVELQAARERAAVAGDAVACPFKGLAPFDVDDADVFFGRERLVAEMVARLAGVSLLGIVGPSGSGKSSALRAGLLPALAQDVLPGSGGWAVALLRPGRHPLRALEQAVAAAPAEGRLVIAVDQFEEVFTACRAEEERTAFADALVAAIRNPRRRTVVLIALRADFYGRCASYPELWRLLGANHVPVGPMRRDELRRVIESPAQWAGLHVDPELADALVADVEGAPGALPLLSTALLELWQQRDGRRLTLAAYEHAGGVRGAVARLAERTYERLDPERRPGAQALLVRLAGVGEGDAVVRRRLPLAELERAPGAAEVLAALTDGRLVIVSGEEAEVAHEALLREWPRLRAWLEEDAENRRLHHHLRVAAREWDARGRDSGELYRGARLAAALDWRAAHAEELDEVERAFVDESRAAGERSHRRLRAVLAGVGALLLLAVVAGVVALEQRGTARSQATAAEAQRLGARALLDDELDRSVLLARQGVALDATARTRGNLLGALLRTPAAIGIVRADHATILSSAVSPDGRTLAIGNNLGEVLLYDTRTRKRTAALEPTPNQSGIFDLAYNPEGDRLAVLHTTESGRTAEYPDDFRLLVALLDTETRRVVARLRLRPGLSPHGVQFSPDGGTLGVSAADDGIKLLRFDARTGRRRGAVVATDHPGRLTFDPFQLWPRHAVLFTHAGDTVVAGGNDAVTVRDAVTLRVRERFPAAGGRAIGTLPTAYALSPDDRRLALGGENGSVRILDLTSGRLRTAAGRHGAAVNEARFTPDGRTLVTAGEDGDVIVWDVRGAAAAETLAGHRRSAFSPAVADDGATLYTASLDGTALIWDLRGDRRLGRRFVAGSADSPRYALSSDGRLLARGQVDGSVSVVELPSFTRRAPFPVINDKGIEGPSNVEGMAFVPGSHLLVVGGLYGSVHLVDADRGRVVRRLEGHARQVRYPTVTANPIWTPGVSADGRLLATASSDGDVRLWSLPDGRPLGAPLRFRPAGTAAVQLSPDGRLLATLPLTRDVVQDRAEVWDVRSRRRVATLRPSAGASAVAFSPDGRRLAVADPRGQLRLYSTATWKPVAGAFAGGGAAWIAFSPDSRTIAGGGSDGTIRLWDVASGQPIGALPGIPNSTAVPLFSARGKHLVAGQDNGRAYRWDLRPASLVGHACDVAGRRLTRAEWEEFLPGRDYAPAC